MNVSIKVIPHKEHRYPTVGDWWFDASKSTIEIRVSDMNNWRYEMLVAVHELIEVLICKHKGITTKQVDKFDMQFEKERAQGKHPDYAEPGDQPKAPYRDQHCIATGVERILAACLGVCWEHYAQAIESLP